MMPYFQIPREQVQVMKNSLMRLTISQGQHLYRVQVPLERWPRANVGEIEGAFLRPKSFFAERRQRAARQRALAWIFQRRGIAA